MTEIEKQQLLIKALSIPSGYAKFKLRMKLHPKQAEILDALFLKDQSKVLFLAANGIGKTSIIGVASILYAIDVLNCTVVSTSATYRQVVSQLVPQLKKYAHLYPKWQFNDAAIKVNGVDKYLGYSSSDDAKTQGFHQYDNEKLLFIVDEAAGIRDSIYQGVIRCNPTYLLVMGSPIGPEGFFYEACTNEQKSRDFKKFKITKYDCLEKDGWWIKQEEIDFVVNMYGMDHIMTKSNVFAEFGKDIENCIISFSDVESALRTSAIPDYTNGKHVALDFAAGGDSNVIVFRNGNEVKIIKEWKDKDTMSACYTFLQELEKLKKDFNLQANEVTGDADGMGGPICDRLKQLGWNINRFHGNSTSTDIDCKNLITDCWINLAKKIRARQLILPNNQEFKLQLTSRKSFMNQSGKLCLESKEDMRSRGIPSPDIADAVAMACSNPKSGILTFAYSIKPKTQSYRGYF